MHKSRLSTVKMVFCWAFRVHELQGSSRIIHPFSTAEQLAKCPARLRFFAPSVRRGYDIYAALSTRPPAPHSLNLQPKLS